MQNGLFRHGARRDERGISLRHRVMRLVMMLERRMQLQGQKFGTIKRTFAGGARMIASVNLNGPVPSRRVSLTAPGVGVVEARLLIIPFIIERGAAIHVNGSLRIYLSTEDLTYLNGDGDTWPWGITEHAQGVFLAPPGGVTCSEGSIAPQWLTEFALDANNSYVHALWSLGATPQEVSDHLTTWLNSEDQDPHRYTGLLRFAVQCCQANYDVTKLRPGTWPDWNPVYYGIFRERDTVEETLRYWLIYIGPNGVRAAPLVHSEVVNCLVDGLYAGTWSGEQALNAEGCVLVTLRLAEGEEGQVVATTEDMASVYASGYSHVAHGWHFSPQTRGSTSETQTAAVSCLYAPTSSGGDDYWETKAWKAIVSFGSSVSVAFSVEGSGSPLLGFNCQLWTPVGPSFHRELGHSGTANSGLIWCTYPSSGPKLVNFDGESSTAASSWGTVIAAHNGCGNGSSTATWSDYAYTEVAGGFGSALTSAGTYDGRTGFGTDHVNVFTSGASGSRPGGFRSLISAYWEPYGTRNECESVDSVTECDKTRPDCTIDTASCTLELWIERYTSSGGGQGCALIILDDPTAMIFASDRSRKVASGGIEVAEKTRTCATSVTITDGDCGGSYTLAGGQNISGTRGADSYVYYYVNPTDVNTTSLRGHIFDSEVGSPTYPYAEGDFRYWTSALLMVGDTEIDLSDIGTEYEKHSHWFCYCRPSECASVAVLSGLTVRASYSGEVFYTPYPSADLISNAGYAADVVAAAQRVRHLL